MFDYENPFEQPEDNPWQDAEFESVVNSPEHQEECDQRAAASEAEDADRETLVANFHERCEQRRKERTQITACRYGMLSLACGLLAYACSYYGINWLAWIIGIAAGAFAITSSYGFGRVREIG